jgi:hypothetical protein
MKLSLHFPRSARAIRAVMIVLWLVIIAKCFVVWRAIDYWHMPFNAVWIIGPTIAFAALATGVWWAHREE